MCACVTEGLRGSWLSVSIAHPEESEGCTASIAVSLSLSPPLATHFLSYPLSLREPSHYLDRFAREREKVADLSKQDGRLRTKNVATGEWMMTAVVGDRWPIFSCLSDSIGEENAPMVLLLTTSSCKRDVKREAKGLLDIIRSHKKARGKETQALEEWSGKRSRSREESDLRSRRQVSAAKWRCKRSDSRTLFSSASIEGLVLPRASHACLRRWRRRRGGVAR